MGAAHLGGASPDTNSPVDCLCLASAWGSVPRHERSRPPAALGTLRPMRAAAIAESQSRPMNFLRLPNLLATRYGRLTAFFLLYVTEGIPLGFAATAVATQLRRQNVGPAEIGAFVGSFYLPWAFKWAFGPMIDVFASDRLGRRRGWIIGT